MEQLKKILGITAVTLIATSANAATITFDDIGIQNSVFPSSAQVRQGFDTEGFHFSNNMDVVDLVDSPWTYYGPAYSGEFAALNDFGGTMVMTKTDRTDFLFSNVFLKSWYGDTQAVTLVGLRGGATVGAVTFAIGNSWQNISTNFGAIDQLELHSSSYFLADNLTVNGPTAPVPEPETFAMLLAGLGMFAGLARQKRKSSKAV